MSFRQHLSHFSLVKHVQRGTFLVRREFLPTKKEFHRIRPTALVFVENMCKKCSLSVTWNANHKHASRTPPSKRYLLYNKQLSIMNEAVATKRERKCINLIIGKNFPTKFTIAHRNKCGQADTLPAQSIFNWWSIFILMKYYTPVNTTHSVCEHAPNTRAINRIVQSITFIYAKKSASNKSLMVLQTLWNDQYDYIERNYKPFESFERVCRSFKEQKILAWQLTPSVCIKLLAASSLSLMRY